MRVLPFVVSGLSIAGSTQGQSLKSQTHGNASESGASNAFFSGFVARAQGASPNGLRQASFSVRDSFTNLASRHNMCLDVSDGKFVAGAKPQTWTCVEGSPNQQWQISGTMLKTQNNLCLDVTDGKLFFGAPVQLWTCHPGNRNQQFEIAGKSIRKVGSNYCLDVRDGLYQNGGQLQLWNCDWTQTGNQVWNFGVKTQLTAQSPSSFLGYATISLPAFMSLHPECSAWSDAFAGAASANGLVPTLLTAIAETESSCNPRPRNGWGLAQFSDDGAWRQFGGDGRDRQNPVDAIWGMARYIRYLLDQSSQSLDGALRLYNGPISQGGNPNYQNEIRQWMSGGNPWH